MKTPAHRQNGRRLPPLIQTLLQPGAYSHHANDLRVHETHISWVILAGPYAYKIKKPVDFGFLDFSTVERRAAVCADEVRLNRRLSRDLYLGVTWVTERDGQYSVGGPGRAVEPAVWMRRLPAEGMLSALLARGAVDARLVARIARKLARFHAVAATGAGVDEYGSPAVVRANWEENFAQTESFVGLTVAPAVRDTIAEYVRAFLEREAPLLEARLAAGRVREGHGDFHADSICVEGRIVQFFDCLEFTPRFRCSDVAAEVAFLSMDLSHYGRADLAAAFVDAYLKASGDQELLRLLDFYRCYRAYVRAKVRSFRLRQSGLAPAETEVVADQARAYFDLAWAYAGGLNGPTLVVVMGLPASGKTTLARALAERLGLVHLSSDVVRKELAGLPPTARRREAFGQGLYGPAVTRRTYALLRRRAARWLRRGFSVVLDATFGKPAERAALPRLAAHHRAHLVVLVCTADEHTLRRRLLEREDQASSASDARLELWPALRAAFVPPVDLPGTLTVDTSGAVTQATERAVQMIRGRGGNKPSDVPPEPGQRSATAGHLRADSVG